MRISDWSSDVCSSDLEGVAQVAADQQVVATQAVQHQLGDRGLRRSGDVQRGSATVFEVIASQNGAVAQGDGNREIGRASCRERVCQYVSISVVAVSLKKKEK